MGGHNLAKPVVIGASVVSIGNQGATPTNTQRGGQQPDSVNVQFPKGMNEQIAKLPAEQQLMYIQRLLKNPQLLQQHQKNIKEKQMKLVQEQQVPLVMGVSKSAPSMAGSRGSSGTGPAAGNSVGVTKSSGAGRLAHGTDGKGKVGGVALKLGSAELSSPSGGSRRKGKGKEAPVDAE